MAVPPDVTGGAGDVGPLQSLVDLLARRHTLAAFWELRGPSQPFRTLARRLSVSEDRLSQRLRELREAGLVEVVEAGDYRLTSEGRRLLDLLEHLSEFAGSWVRLTPRQRNPRGSSAVGRGETGWDD
jgi:DNA-binding HxlR family transcriptional regulator